jgi:tetraacyldisaccharide 4'-kinase
MKLIRKLLLPIAPIYYSVTYLRNKLYDWQVFPSKSYDLPIICVGNLSVGGTGKSPMIEYLIRLLSDKKTATLSRGYKRQSKGFVIADDDTRVELIGDEPYQFKKKFKDLIVAVDEDRQHGIAELMRYNPDVILLDDAYQHRKVSAGFYILLTTYEKPYFKDCPLPYGDLREPVLGKNRADVVVVTKCPNNLSEDDKAHYAKQLDLANHQQLFFSWIAYDDSIQNDEEIINISDINQPFSLVTGIANPKPLADFLYSNDLEFEHLNYPDHHHFTEDELKLLDSKSFILTTEKDYGRLKGKLTKAKLFYIGISVKIDQSNVFENILKVFVSKKNTSK